MNEHTAVIGIGSNINPEYNISLALALIKEKFRFLASSEFVRTKPVGDTEQDDFVNGAVLIETGLSREALKSALLAIEAQLNRERGENKYGPRTIDLDILVWNAQVVDPDVYQRDFLKKSVAKLCPGLRPGLERH